MPSEYERTIAVDAEVEIEVRKSRFLCSLARVATECEARARIDDVRKRYWDANHHCTAWRIGAGGRLQRSSDDGEPAGTAGIPILDVLIHRGLSDTVAIVTRYFGGTKLGAGGLFRAYGSAVSTAIERAGIVERRPLHMIETAIAHADAGRVEHALRASGFSLSSVTYNAENVMIAVQVSPDQREPYRAWLGEVTAGSADPHDAGVEYVDVPLDPGSR
ncbi:MAG: YigZ family protein [Chloroflexia bacterium]|nr:YigZ family protein [Chloroflexia bacterium]